MAQGAFELELKFAGAPTEVATLPRSRLMQAVASGAGRWARLRSVYFDTGARDLAKDGIALRIREKNGQRIQGVKRTTAAGAVVREEYETELTAGDSFPQPVGDADIDEALAEHANALREIAEIRVDRWTQNARHGGSEFEIAVDVGAARSVELTATGEIAKSAETPIAELEIEFISGEMADLFALARLFADNAKLHLSTRTKLETARAAGDGSLYTLDKLDKPDIDGDAPAIEALQAMLAAIAVRIIDVQTPLLETRAVIGVHQMRVALRRFRAIERTFRRALKTDALYLLTRRARSIAHGLGPARDLDVFLEETLPAVFSNDDAPSNGAALRMLAEEKRAIAWEDAYAVVNDPAFTHFALDLLEAGVLAPWRNDASKKGRGPLVDFAPFSLDKALARMRRAEAEMDRTKLAARHPLRIALKKMRYSAQMMNPLYAKEIRKPYMNVVSRLQEALGIVNDAVVAQAIAENLSTGAGPEAMREAGFLTGYKAAEARAAANEIDRAWEIFDNTAPFWREKTEDNGCDTDYPLP